VNVDMPTLKSEFLAHHYAGRFRPRSHYSMGWLPLWAAMASCAPRAANRVTHAPMLEPVLKRAYAYSRTAYDTAAETNNEVKKVFEKQAAEYNRAAIAALEEAFKYAPAGSETLVENVKTAMAAAQSAYNNVAAINKQIYDSVEKTVEQNVNTVKSAATKAKRSTKR
jgi:hypothetical protein